MGVPKGCQGRVGRAERCRSKSPAVATTKSCHQSWVSAAAPPFRLDARGRRPLDYPESSPPAPETRAEGIIDIATAHKTIDKSTRSSDLDNPVSEASPDAGVEVIWPTQDRSYR
jgi:hypothetical protein